MIAPLSFANCSKLIFLRLDRAIELNSFLELNLKTKFIILLVGPKSFRTSIYEIGRVMATCLSDDVSFYLNFLSNISWFYILCLQRGVVRIKVQDPGSTNIKFYIGSWIFILTPPFKENLL